MTDEARAPDPLKMTASEREALFEEYRAARMFGLHMNNALVDRLAKDVLHEGARKLGILKKGTLVLETEDEIVVLMDYCIYNVYRNGRNAAEQYLLDFPPVKGTEDWNYFQAAQKARAFKVLVFAV